MTHSWCNRCILHWLLTSTVPCVEHPCVWTGPGFLLHAPHSRTGTAFSACSKQGQHISSPMSIKGNLTTACVALFCPQSQDSTRRAWTFIACVACTGDSLLSSSSSACSTATGQAEPGDSAPHGCPQKGTSPALPACGCSSSGQAHAAVHSPAALPQRQSHQECMCFGASGEWCFDV